MKKKILLVGGARPNFMKVAPVYRALKKHKKFQVILIHTGQHYDYEMSQSFFNDLALPSPRYFLNARSGTHGVQTGKIMTHFERVCQKEMPALVVVVGDVNSTLAASITAKKLHIPVAHIEAGLRSFDMRMPEEINRMVTDSISDFLFVTEQSGVDNLKKEGKKKGQIFFVGNTMIDSLNDGLKKLRAQLPRKNPGQALKQSLKEYGVVTLHRPSNVDKAAKLKQLFRAINRIAAQTPLIFPIHPRTQKNMKKFCIKPSKKIYIIKPLSYLEFLSLYKDACFVLTDSGGLQEETTFLKIPCFTLRENTERPSTVEIGTNRLIAKKIDQLPNIIRGTLSKPCKSRVPKLWDGRAAERIAGILRKKL